MVSGLETFRKWFEDYSTHYVIIGGTACNLIFAQYGAPERATHGIEMIDGFPVLSLEYLPVFKIHAWANLSDDKVSGKTVHSDEINKHRRDVLRLCALFTPETHVELVEPIKAEIERFVSERPWDDNMMRNLRLGVTAEGMADLIRSVYL